MTRTSARYVFHQEPDLLNPYLFLHSAAGEICNFLCDGLLDYGSAGGYVPRLAREVPTPANGGISGDGTTITYRLRPGLRWCDGTPLTSDAVRFTWEAIVHPDSGSQHRTGYVEIVEVACPDPLTAVVQFKDFYAPALALFPCLLPRHATGEPDRLREWAYNHRPLNSGAFKLVRWQRGDHISVVRNPYYWEPGKPFLDSVRFTFATDREAAIEQFVAGEADVVWNLAEHDLHGLRSVPGTRIVQVPGPVAERLILNQADPRIEARNVADIEANPHPILGDPRVREAIDLAIDKREIVDSFLAGAARVGTNELHVGWMRYDSRPSDFAPRRAAALLEAAGWRPATDGVREATNARYAPDGTRLHLELHTTANHELRRRVAEYLRDSLRRVGIEITVVPAPVIELVDSLPRGSYRHGRYDILLLSQGPEMDPHSYLCSILSPDAIPTLESSFVGWNLPRWVNRKVGSLLQGASQVTDDHARLQRYHAVMAEVVRERPYIYLYSRTALYAHRDDLIGPTPQVWQWISSNSADWRWA